MFRWTNLALNKTFHIPCFLAVGFVERVDVSLRVENGQKTPDKASRAMVNPNAHHKWDERNDGWALRQVVVGGGESIGESCLDDLSQG